MAERRMFAKKVIGSDTFMDMPMSTQILYIHLSMYADDDGFVGNPKMIQRMTRCDAEDFDGLIDGNYIIPFQSGVVAITHWKVNNQIKKDRYRETIYLKEKEMLCETETKTYELKKDGDDGIDWGTDRNSSGSKAEPQYSIVKDSTVKDSTVQFSLDEGCSDFSEEENGNEEEKKNDQNEKRNEEDVITVLPLRNGGKYPIYRECAEIWKSSYPLVDVAQECVRMKLWLDEHPKGHPTLKKLKGFISRWLGNAQEKVCQQLGIPAPGDSNLDWDEFFELARVK